MSEGEAGLDQGKRCLPCPRKTAPLLLLSESSSESSVDSRTTDRYNWVAAADKALEALSMAPKKKNEVRRLLLQELETCT